MGRILISRVNLNHIEELQKIAKQTFFSTFKDSNSAEDMAQYLEEKFSLENLDAELNNQNSEFYFAELNQTVVGYIKLNFGSSQTELQDSEAIEIERFYVSDEFQGQKIGLTLYETALKIAVKRDKKYIWLGVWEHNIKALNFYKKQGFIKFDQHIFKLGNDEQIDFLMKLELKNN